jgi:hypothetical protein
MQALLPKLWSEYQKSFDDGDDSLRDLPEGWMAGAKHFLEFSTDWLNKMMSRDFMFVSQYGEQFVLTDRAGSGDLPDSHAVHAIGKPERGSGDDGTAIQVIG